MNYIVIAAYALGFITLWRLAFNYMINDITYWNGKHRRPDPVDIILSSLLATLTSFIWPIILIPLLAYRLSEPLINDFINKKYADRE